MNTNSTTKIAFKNFRRFQEFPELELGGITYMVGRNNSGKSTLVKALLLINDYLQNQLSDTFSFDNKVLEDANIVTFGRAKNIMSDEPNITFDYQFDNFKIKITISGDDEFTRARVNTLNIKEITSGIELTISHLEESITITKKVISDENIDGNKLNVVKELEESVRVLEQELETITDKVSKEFFQLKDSIRKANEKLKTAKSQLPKSIKKKGETEYELTYPMDLIKNTGNDIKSLGNNEVSKIIYEFIWINDVESGTKKNEKLSNNKLEDVLALSRNSKHLFEFSKRIRQSIDRQYFYFIGANPSKQSALFYLRDKNNALSQAIHNFYQLTVGSKNNEEKRFITHWMNKFEIGENYEINMRAGEAYEFRIFKGSKERKEEKKKGVSLSDKGMGSLQAMTLILKIASLIRLNKMDNKKITVLVEEPELNLHPALQSKLTDFFHEVHTAYGFNFIVETHSEYIIRRSQLLALESDYLSNQDLNPNPFRIFYFHKEQGPYEMEFTEHGKFKKDFGSGFYNEATNISIEIIKNIRKNKS